MGKSEVINADVGRSTVPFDNSHALLVIYSVCNRNYQITFMFLITRPIMAILLSFFAFEIEGKQ